MERIRGLSYVIYVDVYRKDFKIEPHLKAGVEDARRDGFRGLQQETCEIDVVFHQSIKLNSDLEKELEDKSHCGNKIEVLPNMARPTTEYRYLDDVASIDDVRIIEMVGEAVEWIWQPC
ncbi:hypothetical protein F4825DRAFT_417812 [Nemania diffusa]|nr:hypothetical protein F4825DRAFT_417812 [Nemania diffusa]